MFVLIIKSTNVLLLIELLKVVSQIGYRILAWNEGYNESVFLLTSYIGLDYDFE